MPCTCFISLQIWSALITNMKVADILENFHYFAECGYLEDSYKGCVDVIDLLKREATLREQK